MKLKSIVSVSVAVFALAMTGCTSIGGKGSAKNPPPAPPVTQVQPPAQPKQPSGPAKWIRISVWNNLIDARTFGVNSGKLTITNNRPGQSLAIQNDDSLVGLPDRRNELGVVIISETESFTLKNPGPGGKQTIRLIVIDDATEVPVGYISRELKWPYPGEDGKSNEWVVEAGTPATPITPGVDPIKNYQVSPRNTSATLNMSTTP